MLVMVVLIPLVMIIFGAIFLNRSPKKINFFFGYRTALSMKNKDTWDYAHKLIGKIWLILGAITLIISIIPMLFVIGKDDNLIGILGTLQKGGHIICCSNSHNSLARPIFELEKQGLVEVTVVSPKN